MKGLLIKDFRLFWQQKLFFVVLIFLAVFLGTNTSDPLFVMAYLPFCACFFAWSTINYDEFDNGFEFLFTLPFTRKTYAIEKYVFGIGMSTVFWTIGTVIMFVEGGVRAGEELQQFWLSAVVILAVVILMLDLILPLHLKFGAEKGRLVMFVAIGVIFAAVYFGEKLMERVSVDWNSCLNKIFEFGETGLFLAGCAVIAILTIISIGISIHILRKKQF